jgi:hypothetical protein
MWEGNRLLKAKELWDSEASTSYLDNRLSDDGEIISSKLRPAALYPQEDSW